jgi:hypothetical protein
MSENVLCKLLDSQVQFKQICPYRDIFVLKESIIITEIKRLEMVAYLFNQRLHQLVILLITRTMSNSPNMTRNVE